MSRILKDSLHWKCDTEIPLITYCSYWRLLMKKLKVSISSPRLWKIFLCIMKGLIESRIHSESRIWILIKVLHIRHTPHLLIFCSFLSRGGGRGGGGRGGMQACWARSLFQCCLPYSRISSWKQGGKDWQNDKVKPVYYFIPRFETIIYLYHLLNQQVPRIGQNRNTVRKKCAEEKLP